MWISHMHRKVPQLFDLAEMLEMLKALKLDRNVIDGFYEKPHFCYDSKICHSSSALVWIFDSFYAKNTIICGGRLVLRLFRD